MRQVPFVKLLIKNRNAYFFMQLYWMETMEDKSVLSVPVFEFLTTKNDTVGIFSQLNFYRHLVLGVNKKWQPKSVTLDFSFAYLHLVSRVLGFLY
jgi:hypothetical protein